MRQVIFPVQSLQNKEVKIQGDKSISHRALLLGSLCHGTVEIENLSPGKDVHGTLQCLEALGVKFQREKNKIRIQGKGLHGLAPPKAILDAQNSGTTIRLLAGILAGQPFLSTITGDASLRKRDMTRIIKPLEAMGAKIASKYGFAPLAITGGKLKGISYAMPMASAQVKSSLLLAGLLASGTTEVREPSTTRDHTERMLRYLGVSVTGRELSVCVTGGQQPATKPILVPGDFSSAAFLMAAALLVPEANLLIKEVGTNPTRTRLLDLLIAMGGKIKKLNERMVCGEPVADLQVQSSSLHGIEIKGADIPLLMDEIPVLSVLGAKARGTTLIQDAQELRGKESDRIKATVSNLRKMGVMVEELPDGMKIKGPALLQGAVLQGFQDHRIIMSFAVAGLAAKGETIIEGAEWASISFPGFFETLSMLTKRS